MKIISINTLTLLDFPKKTACIIFTPGCNFRCGFCYNEDFVLPEKLEKYKDNMIPEEAFFNFLDTRKGLLDGVVISGGEPTLMPDLIPFIKKIRKKGFLVKLDTNGTNPKILEKIIQEKLVEYIAMDIKTAPENYAEVTGVPVNISKIEKSRDMIMQSEIDYEFRTTVIKEIHTKEVLKQMATFIKGAKKFCLQNFEKKHVLDPKFLDYSSFRKDELEEVAEIFRESIGEVVVH